MAELFDIARSKLDGAAAIIHVIEAPRSHYSHKENVLKLIERAVAAIDTWETCEQAHTERVERAQRVGG
jgi:hypothetical protein